MRPRGFRVPPGRAGRLWLQRRLAVARRGADLLDRKLRIMRGELNRLREAEAQAGAEWRHAGAEAEQWLLRAALLGGQRALRLAADGQLAGVTVSYRAVMGIRYPAGASCDIPEPGTWGGPVLAATRQAHAAALRAAARSAAAAEAVRLMQAEVRATEYRLRAIRDRWIPRLEQALAEVTLAIEEQEIADAARLRLAAGPASGTRAGRGGLVQPLRRPRREDGRSQGTGRPALARPDRAVQGDYSSAVTPRRAGARVPEPGPGEEGNRSDVRPSPVPAIAAAH